MSDLEAELARLRVADSILGALAAAGAWEIKENGEVWVQVDYNLFEPVDLTASELEYLRTITDRQPDLEAP